ncbi:hypothetical protein [Geobacter sp. DSM 9736]|uniref:hypothetical protein n=1 Tax=Geobacter sp. DSM 9736 TaxID=1277350 RepID=UPI000B510A36|nr:hypothetical protein [Geobacter sp. DSM 9736]SNB45485.1 hypothetical protein SAMN06269301_0901 [Geobacter sp. DSM 9736]
MAIKLLQELIETFPQADPDSGFYGEEINGCEAVNFLSEFMPDVRKCLDGHQGSTATGHYAGFESAGIGLAAVMDQLDQRGW